MPVAPYFGYSLIAVLELLLLVSIGFVVKWGASKLKIEQVEKPLLLCSLVSSTILFKQLLIVYSSPCAFVMGFSIFMICFSSYIFGNILDTVGLKPVTHFVRTMKRVLLFSFCVLVFFFCREIIAFGTISIPAPKGLIFLRLFEPHENYGGFFLATIPGTLFSLGVLFVIFAFFNRKILIFRRRDK